MCQNRMSYNNVRSRTFVGVWYPLEDVSHKTALELLDFCGIQYLACCHDRDINEDGSVKKSHVHVYMRFKNPRFLSALAKELGIAENYLQVCRDTKSSMLYLIHACDLDKAQYEVCECFGSLTQELKKYLIDGDESSRILQILDILDEQPVPCSYRRLLVAVCNAGLYGEFRRLGSGVMRLLDEHNLVERSY